MRISALRSLILLKEANCNFNSHIFLGIPRSTLWGHISEIEKSIGYKIIYRKKSGNSFTDEGLAFIPCARQIVECYDNGVAQISTSGDHEISGNLVISTTNAIAVSWLMPSIKNFRQLYPKLTLNITALDYISKNTEQSCDVLLRPLSQATLDPFEILWFIEYHHGLFASEEYLHVHGMPQTPVDLINHQILAYGEHEFTGFEDINWHIKGKWQGLPKIIPYLTINSTLSIIQAARESLGICASAIETNPIYQYDLVQVLPDIKGPKLKSSYCIKTNLSPQKMKAAKIFGTFFKNYLNNRGLDIE